MVMNPHVLFIAYPGFACFVFIVWFAKTSVQDLCGGDFRETCRDIIENNLFYGFTVKHGYFICVSNCLLL